MILLTMQTSCLQSRRIIKSDYCHLYQPLDNNLPKIQVQFWEDTTKKIDEKNKTGEEKTAVEGFVETITNNISTNERIYELKQCGK